MADGSPFVAAVTDALTTGLAAEGFARTIAFDATVDGVCFTSWCRDHGWKQDAVEVSRAQSAPDNVLVHLRIYLPCPPGGRTTLAGTTVAGVIGGRGRIWFPNLLGWPLGSRAPSFGARVLRDTRRALPWFDGYATPGVCLTRLDAGDTPWGLARGRSYQALAAYLADRPSAGA